MKAAAVCTWLRLVLIAGILASTIRAQTVTEAQIVGPPVPAVPSLTQVVKPGVTLPILGTATGPSFQNYVLEWAPGVSPSSGWSTAGFTLANNGMTPLTWDALGTWTPPVNLHGDYTLRLTVTDGGVPTFANTFVYAEPGLISSAWPVYVGTHRFDHGAVPVRQPDGTSRLLIGGPRNTFGGGSGMTAYNFDGTYMSALLDVGGDAQPAAGNLDGQPGDEVVVADGLTLKIFSSSLVLLKTISTPEPRIFWVDQPILADIDGDGVPEIIAVARDAQDATGSFYQGPSGGYLYVFRSDGTLYSSHFPVFLASVLSQYPALGPAGARVVAVDLNGDGIKEIVVTMDAYSYPGGGYTVRAINGDGTVYFNFLSPTYTGFSVDSLSTADLDHDGTPEIVIVESSSDQSTHQIRVLNNNGAVRAGWPVTLSSSITLAIGDLDRNQHNEIVAAANRTLTILRDDGTLWAQPWTIGDGVNDCANTTPLIADIDGDGIPEILLASSSLAQSPLLHRVSFLASYRRDGSIQQKWPLFGMYGSQPYFAVPVVGDFNGDGKTDIAVTVSLIEGGEVDGLFRSAALTWLTTGTTFNATASDWTTNYRDPQNSRSLPPPAALPSAPQITTQPLAQTVAVGGTATFTAAAAGNPAPTYQWQRLGTNIPGATNGTLVLTNVQATENGSAYRMVATNPSGSAISHDVVLTVPAPAIPVFTTQPQAQTVSVGSTATFTAIAVGNPMPTYQWQRNGTNIPGATSTTLNLPNVPASENGANYRAIATNSNGSTISNNVVLTVPAPAIPVFTTQPQAQVVSAGSAAAFTAIAVGNPMPTYQWQKNGTNITGATSTTLNLPNVLLTDNGSNYRSIATNPNGSTTSNTVVLTVASMPAITTQPASRTVNVGVNVTFTAAASGSPAPTFQWQKDGSNLPGATSASLVLTNVQLTDAGSYRVIASNPAGSIASNAATLTVNAPPVFTIQPPPAQYMAPGVDHSFFVLATGSPSPTYQWQKNGVNIAGATSSRLDLPNVQSTDGGTYRAIATNSVGTATSNNMVLTVVVVPAFTKQPVGKAVTAGTSLTLTVTATGVPTPFLQWQKNGVAIPGATTASLSLVNVQPADAGSYDVVAYNLGGSTTSNPAVVTVNVPPVFTIQPPNNFVALVGLDVTLTVQATGTPAPTYQWQKNGVNIAGATSPTLTLTNIQLSTAGTYRAIATNAGGSATSISTVFTVVAGPVITKQPVGKTVTVGANVTLTVAASGTPAPTFQWQKDGTDIPGATSASLVLTGVQLTDTGSYTATATNQGWSVTSNAAVVTVNALPVITTQPVGQTVLAGDTVTFTADATGTPAPTFRWQKNGANITGATNSTLTLANVAVSAAGTYRVIATNAAGSATSVGAVLTVNAVPVITVQPVSRTTNLGNLVTLSVTATGTPAPTYQWLKNDVVIDGATSRTLALGILATDTGAYRVVVSNVVSSVTSNVANVVVNLAPEILTQPVSQTALAGNDVSFTVVATGTPAPTYRWQKNGVNISGATGATLTLPHVGTSATATYRVIVTNSVYTVTSSDAELFVNAPPTITTQPVSKTVNAGTDVTLTSQATGVPDPSFQWQKDGVDLPGIVSPALTLYAVQLADAGSYRVVITNPFGVVVTNTAVLTVKAKPVFVTQPVSSSATVGGSVTFTAVVTGYPAPTYKWQKNGVTISGATGTTLTLNNVQLSSAGTYVIIATNSLGATTSEAVTLTVQP